MARFIDKARDKNKEDAEEKLLLLLLLLLLVLSIYLLKIKKLYIN